MTALRAAGDSSFSAFPVSSATISLQRRLSLSHAPFFPRLILQPRLIPFSARLPPVLRHGWCAHRVEAVLGAGGSGDSIAFFAPEHPKIHPNPINGILCRKQSL